MERREMASGRALLAVTAVCVGTGVLLALLGGQRGATTVLLAAGVVAALVLLLTD